MSEEIEVNEDLMDLNEKIAKGNHELFRKNGIFTINIMGSPGSGKTTLLENILPKLSKLYRITVIEGDLATQNDADRIRKTGVSALQINTGGGCHLDAAMIASEFKKADAENTDLLIIENVGNLVCPIEFYLGEDLRLVVMSTSEGEDKPLKYPPAMLHTDAVVITKTDIAEYVDVDVRKMKDNVKKVNPKARVLEAGKVNGVYSADQVISYIKDEQKIRCAGA